MQTPTGRKSLLTLDKQVAGRAAKQTAKKTRKARKFSDLRINVNSLNPSSVKCMRCGRSAPPKGPISVWGNGTTCMIKFKCGACGADGNQFAGLSRFNTADQARIQAANH